MTLSPAIPLPPLSRVAVIGAGGPSGLVAVRQLIAAGVRPDQILAYEARDRAGGVWNYEADPGQMHVAWRKRGPPVVRAQGEIDVPGSQGPSAMYDKLRTNLPNKVMNYRGSPFPKDTPVFPTHQEVAAYLHMYAEREGLVPLISWSTRVTGVYHTPGATSPSERWTVETEREDGSGGKRVERVSHVIVANGHYNEPYIPAMAGLDSFTGTLVHSRWWRNPAGFRGQNIVVVGSRASGSDVARELAMDDDALAAAGDAVTRTIYQSVRGSTEGVWDDEFAWAKRIRVMHEIVRVDGDILHLSDGTELRDIGAIVFATGYLFSYPFFTGAPFDTHPVTTSLAPALDGLPPAGGHDLRNLNVSDTFYEPDPTLALIGLHYQVNPFPLGEASARLIAHAFTHQRVPPLPPLRRATDDTHNPKVGCPQEFDNQDAWLEAIGEGGDDGGPNHGWKKTPQEVREARANALSTRKKLLGY